MFDGIKRQAGRVYLLYVGGNRFLIATLRELIGGTAVLLVLVLVLVLTLLTLVVLLLIFRP